MNILIIGTGYVGLVSGACFAEFGHNVVCVDIDERKVNALKSGRIPFYEPGLEILVENNKKLHRLEFSVDLSENLNKADVVFICVGTPPKENGQANLEYVYQVARDIGKSLNKYLVVVTKSTVPVGTSKKIQKIIKENYKDEVDVASCPEFIKEGSAVEDFQKPERIVIGTESDRAKNILLQIHEKFTCVKLTTNIQTAEMIKYSANAFLATKISFINEIANVCENVGANIKQVAYGMGLDKRIGKYFLQAGIGYGGSCFPKDVRALHHIAGQTGYPFQLLKAVIEVNNQQRWLFYKKIKEAVRSLENKTIGVWGLSFKPNTDDVRESIAIDLIEKLIEDGAKVKAYDPQATKNAQNVLGNRIDYCLTPELAIQNVDALVIFTDWEIFKNINLNIITEKMNQKLILDGRNMFDPEKMKNLGIKYISIG